MRSSRTVAILNVAKHAQNGDVEAMVARSFGASSIEDCLEIYQRLGAVEREGMDDAIAGIATKAEAAFVAAVDAEVSRLNGASGLDSIQPGDDASEYRRGESWVDRDPELSRLAEIDAASLHS